jgi:hypothetical protein
MSKRPVIITRSQITAPASHARNAISKISESIVLGIDKTVMQGLFVLGVAKFEIMISDTLSIIAKAFPEKLSGKKIDAKSIIDDEFNAIDELVDAHINEICYKGVRDVLVSLSDITGIECKKISKSLLDELIEIKATRNLLLHNDLIVNRKYIDQAGENKRETGIGKKLEFNTPYIKRSCNTLCKICDFVNNELASKYANYTRKKTMEDLWNYIFPTPILKFEDYWNVDEDHNTVTRTGREFPSGSPSNSEMIFLNVWMTHFSGLSNPLYKVPLHMKSLDSNRKDQLLWLLNILSEYNLD